jgi:hypothetical protein
MGYEYEFIKNKHQNQKPKDITQDILKGLKESLNNLSPKNKLEMEKLSMQMIRSLDALDLRIEFYELIEKYENLYLSGILENYSKFDDSNIEAIEICLQTLRETKSIIEMSLNETEKFANIEILISGLDSTLGLFSYANTFPEIGDEFIQYLFNISKEEITAMSVLYSKLSILLEISIIYNSYLISNKTKGMNNNPSPISTKLGLKYLLKQMNLHSYILVTYYDKGFDLELFRKTLNAQFKKTFQELILNKKLESDFKNAANKNTYSISDQLNTVEQDNLDSVENPNLNGDPLINIKNSNTATELSDRIENNIIKLDLFDKTILDIKNLGLDIEVHNKAKQQKNKLKSNYNWNAVLEVFEQIKTCGGSLDAFVSKNSSNNGLNVEYLKGKNSIMSVRLNQKHRLSLTQDTLGKITILSFGGHYDFLKARN